MSQLDFASAFFSLLQRPDLARRSPLASVVQSLHRLVFQFSQNCPCVVSERVVHFSSSVTNLGQILCMRRQNPRRRTLFMRRFGLFRWRQPNPFPSLGNIFGGYRHISVGWHLRRICQPAEMARYGNRRFTPHRALVPSGGSNGELRYQTFKILVEHAMTLTPWSTHLDELSRKSRKNIRSCSKGRMRMPSPAASASLRQANKRKQEVRFHFSKYLPQTSFLYLSAPNEWFGGSRLDKAG